MNKDSLEYRSDKNAFKSEMCNAHLILTWDSYMYSEIKKSVSIEKTPYK